MSNVSPCVTRSKPRGHLIMNRNRYFTIDKICKMQGIHPRRLTNVDSNLLFGKCIGNGISINVMSKIITNAVQCPNLVSHPIHHPFTRVCNILKYLSAKGHKSRKNPNMKHDLWGVNYSRGTTSYLAINAATLAQL